MNILFNLKKKFSDFDSNECFTKYTLCFDSKFGKNISGGIKKKTSQVNGIKFWNKRWRQQEPIALIRMQCDYVEHTMNKTLFFIQNNIEIFESKCTNYIHNGNLWKRFDPNTDFVCFALFISSFYHRILIYLYGKVLIFACVCSFAFFGCVCVLELVVCYQIGIVEINGRQCFIQERKTAWYECVCVLVNGKNFRGSGKAHMLASASRIEQIRQSFFLLNSVFYFYTDWNSVEFCAV